MTPGRGVRNEQRPDDVLCRPHRADHPQADHPGRRGVVNETPEGAPAGLLYVPLMVYRNEAMVQ